MRIAVAFVISSVILVPSLLGARSTKLDVGEELVLAPNEQQSEVAGFATKLLTRGHYRKTRLDNGLSSEILDRFVETLDPNRSFFLAEDVAGFEAYRLTLDDALKSDNLQPPFDMFNVYKHRVGERVTHARDLLKTEFDFEKDESYDIDRTEAAWATDKTAMDELWRKRVKNDILRLRLTDKAETEIIKTLDKRYQELERRVGELDSEDIFQFFMNSFAASIEPHTSYLAPRTSENFQISMRLSLEGIGAVLQREAEYTTIRRIVEGGPASMHGVLQVGDRIVAVAESEGEEPIDVIGWRLDDVVDLIRGPKGSTVKLFVLPVDTGLDGAVETIALVRDRVKLEEQAAKSSIIEIESEGVQRRIGVIDLPTFYLDFAARARRDPDYRSSTRDVRKLLRELKAEAVDGVIVDLRGNGGGSLIEATELTGLFIDSGPVVQVKDARNRIEVERDTDPGVEWNGPLSVLVNRNSASASEIFAAAIQDYGRGLIVGEPTFGKGTVQNLIDLNQYARRENPSYGQLKLTIAQFFRVNGGSTQHRGVIPDITFPTSLSDDDYGESAFDNALPWTSINPAKYTIEGDFSHLLPALEKRSLQRISASEEFDVLLEELQEFKEARESTVVSLQESARRAEMESSEARREARDARLEAIRGIPSTAAGGSPEAGDLVEAELEPEADEEDEPDLILRESGAILADIILLTDRLKRTAQLDSEAPATN